MTKILFKKITLPFFIFLLNFNFLSAQNIPFTCNSDAYFSHHAQGGDNLFRFTPDYNFTLITQVDFSLNGIAFNPKDNFIYALNEVTNHIVRLDQNGDYIDLGMPVGMPSGGFWAGTFSKDGAMIISGGTEYIVRLDVTVSPPLLLSAEEKYYADGSSGNPSFGDIAVDPSSGICYSIDNGKKQIVIIDPVTGEVTPYGAILNHSTNGNGALYFDGNGELTAFYLKDIYKIDKVTGVATYSGEGLDINNGIDACGCLNPIQFEKSVDNSAACAGDTLTFTFRFTNESEQTFSNIQFSDSIPSDLILVEMPNNTFGGNIDIAPLGNFYNILTINEMEIPVGVSEFTIKAIATGNPNNFSTVYNQATAVGFAPSWESRIVSDDPSTTPEGDPTAVVISPTPMMDLSLNFEGAGCEGTPFEISAMAPISGDFFWEMPNDSIFTGTFFSQPIATLEDNGFYNITFTDAFGCELDTFFNVEILSAPFLDLGKDSMICLQEPVSIYAGAHHNYLWQDGSTNSVFLVENYGTYSVQVENENGCLSEDNITFTSGCLPNLFVPNAFSPNGDGSNDIFYAYGLEVVDFNLKIFDRWGEFIFESNDISKGWDGFFNGKIKQTGVYVWVIEASFLNGETHRFEGDVTLVK